MNESRLACVLVVEFDTVQRALIELSLKRNHFLPVICQELEDVQNLIREHQPEVLLLDLYLPGANSLDLLRELRREGLLLKRSTIILSAMGFPEIVQKAMLAGADDFIVKPFDPAALISRIQKNIERKAQA